MQNSQLKDSYNSLVSFLFTLFSSFLLVATVIIVTFRRFTFSVRCFVVGRLWLFGFKVLLFLLPLGSFFGSLFVCLLLIALQPLTVVVVKLLLKNVTFYYFNMYKDWFIIDLAYPLSFFCDASLPGVFFSPQMSVNVEFTTAGASTRAHHIADKIWSIWHRPLLWSLRNNHRLVLIKMITISMTRFKSM